jgi:hypothetical protein
MAGPLCGLQRSKHARMSGLSRISVWKNNDVGRMRLVPQDRHVAKDRPRFVDTGDVPAVLDCVNRTLDQEE